MRKGIRRFLCAAMVLLLCAACGDGKPESNHTTDYSGTYTDKQGTDEVYSMLELRSNGDGGYTVSVSLYRLASLEGAADGGLHFVSDVSSQPAVEGDISINGGEAELTVTKSDFPGIDVGMVYRFPDGE